MSTRSLSCIAALTLAALASPPAAATLITGSFSGIARGEIRDWGDGTITPFAEPVTGRFSFETAIPPPSGCCDPPIREPGSLFYQGRLFDFSAHVFDDDTDSALYEGSDYDSVTLLDDGTRQSFGLRGGGPYWYWAMTFVAADGGLFQDFDPESFDPTQVDLGASWADFSGDIRSYGSIVSFDTLVFDGYPALVPEPATFGLFATGLLLMARRKRRCVRLRRGAEQLDLTAGSS
jgi:hypothetical protein